MMLLLQTDPNWQRSSSFRGITRRFILAMAVLSVALVVLLLPVVFTIIAVLTPPPFEYQNLPFQVCAPRSTVSRCEPLQSGDVFYPGEIIPFVVDRCASDLFARSAVLPYMVSRNVVNDDSGIRIILPSLSTEIPAAGCSQSITVAHQLPESIPPGRYFIEGVATVYGRFRTVNSYFRTTPFTVAQRP
jgi:hypothetical protein